MRNFHIPDRVWEGGGQQAPGIACKLKGEVMKNNPDFERLIDELLKRAADREITEKVSDTRSVFLNVVAGVLTAGVLGALALLYQCFVAQETSNERINHFWGQEQRHERADRPEKA